MRPLGTIGQTLLFGAFKAGSGVGGELWAISGAAPPAPRVTELIASHSQKCLDVPGWSFDDGIPGMQWACTGGDNQTWNIENTSDGYSRLIAATAASAWT